MMFLWSCKNLISFSWKIFLSALEAAFSFNEYTTDLLHYCFIFSLVINVTFTVFRSNSGTNFSTNFYTVVEEVENVKGLILESIE